MNKIATVFWNLFWMVIGVCLGALAVSLTVRGIQAIFDIVR